MANHKSSLKRIRQEETRRLHNRYYGKTMRNAVRKLRATTDKKEAVAMYPGITKMLDKLAKTNVIHKNKANNLKSKLALYINKSSLNNRKITILYSIQAELLSSAFCVYKPLNIRLLSHSLIPLLFCIFRLRNFANSTIFTIFALLL